MVERRATGAAAPSLRHPGGGHGPGGLPGSGSGVGVGSRGPPGLGVGLGLGVGVGVGPRGPPGVAEAQGTQASFRSGGWPHGLRGCAGLRDCGAARGCGGLWGAVGGCGTVARLRPRTLAAEACVRAHAYWSPGGTTVPPGCGASPRASRASRASPPGVPRLAARCGEVRRGCGEIAARCGEVCGEVAARCGVRALCALNALRRPSRRHPCPCRS